MTELEQPLTRVAMTAATQPTALRTVVAMPEATFDGAVGIILGQPLHLRPTASPAGGWLTYGGGGPGNFEYSGYGTTFFSIGRNAAAESAWQAEVHKFEDIAGEVSAGRFQLLDVHRLRAVQAAVDKRANALAAVVEELGRWGDPAAERASGAAAEAMSARFAEVTKDLTSARDRLRTPDPSVSAALAGAADALAAFAQQLSSAWWKSGTVFLNSPHEPIQAIFASVQNYVQAHLSDGSDDTGGSGQGSRQLASIEDVRRVLAGYSSDAGGGLLPGMDPIAGDLTQPAVWAAANASITQRITTELDKLDALAKPAVDKLAGPFQALTERLKMGSKVAGVRITHPLQPTSSTQTFAVPAPMDTASPEVPPAD